MSLATGLWKHCKETKTTYFFKKKLNASWLAVSPHPKNLNQLDVSISFAHRWAW
jgi:hypothetical protein